MVPAMVGHSVDRILLEDGAILEYDVMVAKASVSLVPHEVGRLHLAVWPIARAVDDDFGDCTHYG